MRQEDILDRIRPMIVEASVEASPENYELCHRVVTRSDPLAAACFEKLSSAGEFNAQAFRRLKEAAGAPRGQVDHVAVMRLVDRQLETIQSIAKDAQVDATDYSSSLDAAIAALGRQDPSGMHVKIVEQLVVQALGMAQKAFALEERLERASSELDGLRKDLARARSEGATDALTSLPNRRAFDEHLAEAIANADGGRKPLSLAFCDIDHFKSVNDQFGHKLGDQVLRLVASQLRDCFADVGFTARYGGEEFVSLLPGHGSADAMQAAQALCQSIVGRTIRCRNDGRDIGRITLSIGVATLRRGERAEAFIERADQAMYQAKSQGRNRVICGA